MTDSAAARIDAALRFLQTVVVVDDHAYTPPEVDFGGEHATLDGESLEHDAPAAPLAADEAGEDPQDFHTETVVEGFADLGIYCAVLKPSEDNRTADMHRVEMLARRADIVILDWILEPRTGVTSRDRSSDGTSLDFIRDILKKDRTVGGRTRLICIYTGESRAADILSRIDDGIQDEVRARGTSATKIANRVDVGSTRILVLGKEREYRVGTIESVRSADLPQRMVDEFAGFVVTGLLREVAVESLAAIRDESHRLLRRFDGALDAPLLSHRSVTSPADAEEFSRSLVGSELAAVVAAADVTTALSDDRVNEVIDAHLHGRTEAYFWKTYTADASSAQTLDHDHASRALKLGIDERGTIRGIGPNGSSRKLEPQYSRTALLLPGDTHEVRARSRELDARFAMLSTLARDATFDAEGARPPRMQLGTIVVTSSVENNSDMGRAHMDWSSLHSRGETASQGSGDTQYWVCLQPLCDSVRLNGTTRFPLLPLKVATDVFNYVVMDGDAPTALLQGGLKLSEIDLPGFAPARGLQTIDAAWLSGSWVFEDISRVRYVWVGSLRLDKAHRLLHSVANAAGRIGVDEFEFLRLNAPKPRH